MNHNQSATAHYGGYTIINNILDCYNLLLKTIIITYRLITMEVAIFRVCSHKHTQCCPRVQVLPVYQTDDILCIYNMNAFSKKTDFTILILLFNKYIQ